MRTVSREELYAQVWSKPMTKVAAEYGVTGTALKKTCNRHQISTPPLGYWAKLEHGKRVTKPDLPKLDDPRLQEIRVAGSRVQGLPGDVRSAREKARKSLEQHTLPVPDAAEPSAAAGLQRPEAKILAATRRAIARARADSQGFAAVQGAGIIPLRIAPASVERALAILNSLLALAETQGHQPRGAAKEFALVVNGEAIAFGLEEQSQRTPHEPTAAELKERDRRSQWGYTIPPWLKSDHTPSGRLAVVIDANPYSGLRRTYADGKTQRLVEMLPEVLASFTEHAAFARERRRVEEERARAFKAAEARRHREAAFEAREKRRMEFVEAVDKQLIERARLSAVLSHLETATADDADRLHAMIAWLRRRIQQIGGLVNPRFLDISSRAAKVDFEEPRPGADADDRYSSYLPPAELRFWSIDEEKGLATAVTSVEWLTKAGPGPDPDSNEAEPTIDQR